MKRARIAPNPSTATGQPSTPAIIVSLAGADTRVSLAQARSFRDDLSEAIAEIERQLPQFILREARSTSASDKETDSFLPLDVRHGLLTLCLTRGCYFVASEMGFISTAELEELCQGKGKRQNVIDQCVKWAKERIE